MSKQNTNQLETAILANGCFWCTESVFQQLKGVKEVISGYTGGTIKNPCYREICTGRTGHAEAIKIVFDATEVSFAEILEVFFATHDPTTLNRQGNDVGTQYRSGIFYTNAEQEKIAKSYIQLLDKEGIFSAPIVTEVTPEAPFYKAEEEHQNFYNNNPNQPYCQYIIKPKLHKIRKYFPNKLKTVST
ncbi:Peptide methionine sulfoxide reductase MsrA [Croceitalea dokdonensis DOKDO 023]|uniref:Peptide methionine sulfoxide reductase MsrA n=1 Tax=Croceitalea dokdonensis DOKDO 023 TaxID=1300341 RepID=A0A0P7AMZ5_9FLAO|nr:peptide-methionine (S)-S-oxide reductase MsrA [Croceitalea dokdonensis]KPM33286.1 Peptide methionine sulfoxide reductase MsrA [Croceitalea dokdonensis DOKDO 023]